MQLDTLVTAHIDKGGQGSIRWECRGVECQGAHYGPKCRPAQAQHHDAEDRLRDMVMPGSVSVEHGTYCSPEGEVRCFVEAWFADIFSILRNLDGGVPCIVRPGMQFYLRWSSDVLTVKWKWASQRAMNNPCAARQGDEFTTALIITTAGRFIWAAGGTVSPDRKSLEISGIQCSTRELDCGFKVAGLAVSLEESMHLFAQDTVRY